MVRPAPVEPARTESVAHVLRATAATAVISGLPVTNLPALAENAPVQAAVRSIRPPVKISGASALRDLRAVPVRAP